MDLPKLGEQLCLAMGKLRPAQLSRNRTFLYNLLLTDLLQQCGQASEPLLDTVEEVRDRLPGLALKLPPLLRQQCASGQLHNETRLCLDMLTPTQRQKTKPGEISLVYMRQCVKTGDELVRYQAEQGDFSGVAEDSENSSWIDEEEEVKQNDPELVTSSSSSEDEEEVPAKKKKTKEGKKKSKTSKKKKGKPAPVTEKKKKKKKRVSDDDTAEKSRSVKKSKSAK